jgi:hypothetical protein
MKAVLERSELAILVLHMNIMRKSIKKGFKANYGLLEGRRKLGVFDELKDLFVNELNENIDPIEFDLSDQEFDMLHSFINFYVQEIQKSAESQQVDIVNDEQILFLIEIRKKVNALLETAEKLKRTI